MPRTALPIERRRARLNILVYPSTLAALRAAGKGSGRSLGGVVDYLVCYAATANVALSGPPLRRASASRSARS